MSGNSNKEPSAESGLQRIMNSAVEYFLAGERCNASLAFGQYPQHELGTPVVVLYAFSIELALKVLLGKVTELELNSLPIGSEISFEEINVPKGHSLKSLFELLPDDSQDKLQFLSNKHKNLKVGADGNNDASSELEDWSAFAAQLAESDFVEESILDQIDKAFVDWRYHFEKPFVAVSTPDLNRAFVVVHTEIRRKFPDFMSKRESGWGRFELDWLGLHTALKIMPTNMVGAPND